MKRIVPAIVIFLAYLALCSIAGILVSEASLHLHRLPLRHRQEIADRFARKYHATVQDVSLTTADDIQIKAWYVQPADYNGNVVVLLHGITDNREGVAGYGDLFLDHGYAVLLPDARDHGESGGSMATYGIREADDVHRWVSWIYAHAAPNCVFGFGESYGASLLLQSLPLEPRFCAVVAESPFSTAREMTYERVSGPLHLGAWFGKTVGHPVIDSALLYARLRYRVDLLQPSPLYGVTHSRVPVLLIHGEKDKSISPRHSQMIAAAATDHVTLWLVPGAGHTQAWAAAPQAFETRVPKWFSDHQKPQTPSPTAQK